MKAPPARAVSISLLRRILSTGDAGEHFSMGILEVSLYLRCFFVQKLEEIFF